ncbi:MAG: sodium:solute symporter family protein [Bacillota bacterium]|nr:sodium:solute symporter family protein [Bacillota bacterium]MDW7682660.1 sodium:solute symporter family protein [Bacillota bacterium]
MSIGGVFLVISVTFGALLIAAGLITRKWVNDSSDFILAGREISLALNIFGVAAIGFAGTSIALSPGFAILYGFWGSFISLGIIFSIGGLSLYGLFFTTFVRRCGAQTLPEWLELRYSSKVRLIITIGTILGLTGIMANNVVSMSGVITGFTGWPLYATISVIFFLFLLFSYLGGFWAITFTDFLQLIVGLIAVPLIIFSFFSSYGDFAWLQANWASEAGFLTSGLTGMSMPVFSLKYPSFLTFAFLFAAFLVWGNNYYWLRAASCRSERTAKLSFFWAGVLLCVVFYVPLTLVGSFVGAAYPDLFAPIGTVPAVAAYGVFLRELPVFIAAFLLLTSLAAGVSTSTTAHIGASSVAVRDIYQKYINPSAKPQQLILPSRVILLALGVLVWFLSFYPGGPVYLFAFSTSWLGPPSLLVFLGIVWRRFNAVAALWSAAISMATMFVLTLLELTKIFAISQYSHVGIVGFIAAIIPAVIITYATKPKYYGSPDWVREPNENNREDVKLDQNGLEVLMLIRMGYANMSELCDILGQDAGVLNKHVEKLDLGGYIVRQSLTGSGFYAFTISTKGIDALPEFSEEETVLLQDNLSLDSVRVLRIAAQDTGILPQLISSGEYTSLEISATLSKLIRNGYLLEGGFWKRTISLTETGKAVLDKHKGIKTKEVSYTPSAAHIGKNIAG